MTSRLDELFADLPPRLTADQVAELLAVSPKGVYRWINAQVIPAYKVGTSWIILRDELKDTLASGSNLAHQLPGGDGETAEEVPDP